MTGPRHGVMRPRAPDSRISLPTPPPPTGGFHLCSGTCSLRVQTPSQPPLPAEPQRLQVAHPVTSSLTTAIPHNQKDTISGVLKKKSLASVLLSTSPVGQLQDQSPQASRVSACTSCLCYKIRIGCPLLADELEHKALLVPTRPPPLRPMDFSSGSAQGSGTLCRTSYGPHPGGPKRPPPFSLTPSSQTSTPTWFSLRLPTGCSGRLLTPHPAPWSGLDF